MRPYLKKYPIQTGHQWLTPIILTTQESLSLKTRYKKGLGGVAQGVGPEFKPQYWKKK
jgi:hypothetical protein